MPVLERPQARAEPELFAAGAGHCHVLRADAGLPAAGQLAERAVELARELGDDQLIIEALSARCAYCYFAGEPGRGFPLGQEAVAARARGSATISCSAAACMCGC